MVSPETFPGPIVVDRTQEPIVRALAYYDLFEYPLRSSEIFTFLQQSDVREPDLQRAVRRMAAHGVIGVDRGHYFLPHRSAAIVARRLEMEARGAIMWRTARRTAWIASRLPFVRAIFVSGQLCRYIADEKSDIDFFVVTEQGRLWIVRTMFLLTRALALGKGRTLLCANYYVSAENLHIREHNLYTACEIASVKPVFGLQHYDRFLAINRWIEEFYPNFSPDRMERHGRVHERGRLQGLLERLVPSRLADRLDARLMALSIGLWERRLGARAAMVRTRSYCMRRDEARAHPDDPTRELLVGYHALLERYGIPYD